ncbi:hypothetical protein ACFQ0T_23650 [Kitasatospora gansuensis]
MVEPLRMLADTYEATVDSELPAYEPTVTSTWPEAGAVKVAASATPGVSVSVSA